MEYIDGKILTKTGFQKGYIIVSENQIQDIQFGTCPKSSKLKGLITPSFVNMHTHLGDAFIANKPIELPHDIQQLVAPPDGLKHRLLKTSSSDS